MNHFLLAPEVRKDLDEIWNYIGIEKGNLSAAQ